MNNISELIKAQQQYNEAKGAENHLLILLQTERTTVYQLANEAATNDPSYCLMRDQSMQLEHLAKTIELRYEKWEKNSNEEWDIVYTYPEIEKYLLPAKKAVDEAARACNVAKYDLFELHQSKFDAKAKKLKEEYDLLCAKTAAAKATLDAAKEAAWVDIGADETVLLIDELIKSNIVLGGEIKHDWEVVDCPGSGRMFLKITFSGTSCEQDTIEFEDSCDEDELIGGFQHETRERLKKLQEKFGKLSKPLDEGCSLEYNTNKIPSSIDAQYDVTIEKSPFYEDEDPIEETEFYGDVKGFISFDITLTVEVKA